MVVQRLVFGKVKMWWFLVLLYFWTLGLASVLNCFFQCRSEVRDEISPPDAGVEDVSHAGDVLHPATVKLLEENGGDATIALAVLLQERIRSPEIFRRNELFDREQYLCIFRDLVDRGADLSQLKEHTDKYHLSPLMKVASCLSKDSPESHTRLIQDLVDAGHDINQREYEHEGFSALDRLLQKGVADPAKFLIRAGAEVNQVDKRQRFPLQVVADPNFASKTSPQTQQELLSLLFFHGADVSSILKKYGDWICPNSHSAETLRNIVRCIRTRVKMLVLCTIFLRRLVIPVDIVEYIVNVHLHGGELKGCDQVIAATRETLLKKFKDDLFNHYADHPKFHRSVPEYKNKWRNPLLQIIEKTSEDEALDYADPYGRRMGDGQYKACISLLQELYTFASPPQVSAGDGRGGEAAPTPSRAG